MKKAVLAICAAIGLAMIGTSAMAVKPDEGKRGNNLPKLPMKGSWKMEVHAYLNNCPQGDFKDSNRRVIVIEAEVGRSTTRGDTNDILLAASADGFHIDDGNACDGDPAELYLPSDVVLAYQVYAKLKGNVDNSFNFALCGTVSGDDTYCNTGTTLQASPRKFQEISTEFLTLYDRGEFCDGSRCEIFAGFGQEVSNPWIDIVADDKAKASFIFIPCNPKKSNTPDPTEDVDCHAL